MQLEITLRGVAPLDDLVFYVRECAARLESILEEPERCTVVIERRAATQSGARFEARVRVTARGASRELECTDSDLYVAVWRAFDLAMRQVLRKYARDERRALGERARPPLPNVREVRGTVVDVPGAPAPNTRGLLAAARIRCQTGADEHDGLECVRCRRFVNFRPSSRRDSVTIRCQWSEDDRVGEVMTLWHEVVVVSPTDSVEGADEVARAHGILHLPVVQDGELVGIVCRCDLLPGEGGELVADRMSRQVRYAASEMTLLDAAAVMSEHGVGCLPVVNEGRVVGILSRSDLRDVGVDEERLGAAACAACGSVHGVRRHPASSTVQLCLDCIDVASTPAEYDELGVGD